jgi:isoquinoline 1-oxidoreductase beta subunit
MIYGVVLRSPVEGGGPDRVDESKVKAIDGVIRIVRLPYGVGVLAESAWAALAGRRALDGAVTWTRTGMGWGFDSDAGMEAFAAAASNLKAPATDWDRQGNAPDEMTKAATDPLMKLLRCTFVHEKASRRSASTFPRRCSPAPTR